MFAHFNSRKGNQQWSIPHSGAHCFPNKQQHKLRSRREKSSENSPVVMRTRRSIPSVPVEQKTKKSSSCNLDETFDADIDKENVDVNVKPQHRGGRGKGLTNTGRKKLVEQKTTTQKSVFKTTSSKKVIESQGKPLTSKNRAMSQETPPTFEFTHKKKTMVRKRKLFKEQEGKNQCDQKRIEDLVEYFKSLDSQKLNIVP